jgi:hypothetical protein
VRICTYKTYQHDAKYLFEIFSEEKFFYESTNQQRELPVLAMFANRSKISNIYKGPSIDATYLNLLSL